MNAMMEGFSIRLQFVKDKKSVDIKLLIYFNLNIELLGEFCNVATHIYLAATVQEPT
jgi:hypothetical protein